MSSHTYIDLNISNEKTRAAVGDYNGIRRRFDSLVKNDRIVYIDDYAHHPEELRALINSAKTLFRGKKCTVIFQPHLFTRTRDFAEGFGETLSLADEVILLPIYPARELPIEGVTSEMIAEKIKGPEVIVMERNAVPDWIRNHRPELLITAGAGDIDLLREPLTEILN